MEPFVQITARDSFTPVRRKEITINEGRLYGAREQEWTTARCFRLLRALTSRVSILRKELSRNISAPENCEDPQAIPVAKRKMRVEDGDWTRTRKKLQQTYSSKRKECRRGYNLSSRCQKIPSSTRRRSFVPGEVSVPTPILVRANDERIMLVTPPGTKAGRRRRRCRARFTLEPSVPQSHLVANQCEIRYKPTSSRRVTLEGIYNGLDALLRSTAKALPRSKALGARSLLSMSKRIVPKYITQQEILLLDHMEAFGKSAIVSRDISIEIYDELEALGSSGSSWKGLRSVVLSHGLQVISSAIHDDLFDAEFCGLLIDLCVSTYHLDEAEILLATVLDSSEFREPSTLYDSPDPRLVMLWKYTETTGRVAFQYRQLSTLIMNKVLPMSWLATKAFGRFWTDLIKNFTDNPINLGSFDFLCVALPLLAKAQGLISKGQKGASTEDKSFAEALQNTFSSLLASILSICMLHRETRVRGQLDSKKPPDYKRIIILLQSCLADYITSQTVFSLPYVLFLLNVLVIASFTTNGESDLTSKMAVRLVEHLQRPKKDPFGAIATRSGLVQFLSNTARCCGRGASTSGFEFLRELHILLESLDWDLEIGDTLKGVIVDSAYLFSQIVPDRQLLDYATSLDTRFGVRAVVPDGSPEPERSGDTISGFRWEEGIGEWVTTTPALVHKRKAAEFYPLVNEKELEEDSPYRPPPHLRRVIRERNHPRASICTRTEALWSSGDSIDDLCDGAVLAKQSLASESEDELVADLSSDEETKSISESISQISSSERSTISDPSSVLAKSSLRREQTRAATRSASRPFHMTPLDNEDWQISGESSPSGASTLSQESKPPALAHRRIHRAPRLGRRALRSRQAWNLFDESDDELSFVSTSSAFAEDIRDTATSDDLRICPSRSKKPSAKRESVPVFDESEDELCFG